MCDLAGARGGQVLGIPLRSSVKQATELSRGSRWLHNPSSNIIKSELHRVRSALTQDGEDIPLWRHGPDQYHPHFSTKHTWNQIRVHHPQVSWHKGVWFTYAIPKYVFLTWLAFHDRLSTLDRMYKWNSSISQTCLLCRSAPEKRNHLFFHCSYANRIWKPLTIGILGNRYSSSWLHLIPLLTSSVLDKELRFLFRLAFQSTLYHIWRERNTRMHTQVKFKPERLFSTIDKTIRNRFSTIQTMGNHAFDTCVDTLV